MRALKREREREREKVKILNATSANNANNILCDV